LLGGALITAVALWAFPHSAGISDFISKVCHFNMPAWGGLLIAALLIWVIDACINIAQGPYRSLIPDVVPKEQHAQANSYISLAIGLGSVIAMVVAPALKFFFDYQMSISAQFIMAGLAFALAMLWTCLMIKEKSTIQEDESVRSAQNDQSSQSFWQSMKEFFLLSPEVKKICTMQFFTWIGMMCLLIYVTPFVMHTVYNIPDVAANPVAQNLKDTAQNYALICLAVFNLVCFLVAIPIGKLADKFGNKKVHIISMLSMVLAYLGLALFKNNPTAVLCLMGLSGIGWASVCALPFAMLSKYIKPGTEGSVMGIFNIFIAGPQVFVCTLVGWLINASVISINGNINHHYEYTFYIGAACLLAAVLVTKAIKE
jgi:maltose/moltooligosaccharide transporter